MPYNFAADSLVQVSLCENFLQAKSVFYANRPFSVFTALHAMQTRSSDENSVCLSVCLSVYLSVCPAHACMRVPEAFLQNGRKICPDLYTIQKII